MPDVTTYEVSSRGGLSLKIPAAGPRWAAQHYKYMTAREADTIDGQPYTPAKGNKFNAKRTEYNGRVYASNAEAQYAAQLDYALRAGAIEGWTPQPVVMLGPIRFQPDFRVAEKGGVEHYVDVKGAMTQRFRDICKLWREHGPARLLVVRKGGVEVIEGKGVSDATVA